MREQPHDVAVDPVDTHHPDESELQLESKLELKFQSKQKPEREPKPGPEY